MESIGPNMPMGMEDQRRCVGNPIDATMGDDYDGLSFSVESSGYLETIVTKRMCNEGDGKGTFRTSRVTAKPRHIDTERLHKLRPTEDRIDHNGRM